MPLYYRERVADFWFEVRDIRLIVAADTVATISELQNLRNVRYHDRPVSKDATDAERLDVHNGLLLAIHLDALFDRGLLAFTDDGEALLSPLLLDPTLDALGLAAGVPPLRRVAAGTGRTSRTIGSMCSGQNRSHRDRGLLSQATRSPGPGWGHRAPPT